MADSARPDFSHLGLNDKGSPGWLNYMERHASQLEEILWKFGTCKTSWGTCLVCGIEYPANLKSHIWGKAHCGKVKERLGWREPMSPEELESYTQRWPMSPGTGAGGPAYFFNHITGMQGFCDASGELSNGGAPPVIAPRVVPSAPATPAAPTVQAVPAQGSVNVVCPPCMPAAAGPSTSGGQVVFRHGPNFTEAFNGIEAWRTFMTEPSRFLEEYLSKATGHWDHRCCVCEKQMSRGAEDHLKSKDHWKTLWKRLEDNNKSSLPPQHIAEEMQNRPWVQQFDLPRGTYLFNHLTGGQQIVPGGGGTPSNALREQVPYAQPPSIAPQPPSVAPQPVPVPITAPSTTSTGSIMAQGGGGGGVRVPSYQDARIIDPRTPSRNGVGYREALDDKPKWVRFMDEPASQLEAFIYKALPGYSEKCPVCDSNVNGIKEHLLSQKHWKQMWNRLQGHPSVEDALSWERPWVQRLRLPNGYYLFNHVTGSQGMEDEVKAARSSDQASTAIDGHVPPSAGVPPQAPPPPRVAGPYLNGGKAAGPPSAASMLQSLGDDRNLSRRAAPTAPTAAGAGGEFELWHWKGVVMRPASELATALAHGRGEASVYNCCVCDATFDNVEQHLASDGHYANLRSRVGQVAESQHYEFDKTKLVQPGQPWIQDFGGGILFNHVTLQVVPQLQQLQ